MKDKKENLKLVLKFIEGRKINKDNNTIDGKLALFLDEEVTKYHS